MLTTHGLDPESSSTVASTGADAGSGWTRLFPSFADGVNLRADRTGHPTLLECPSDDLGSNVSPRLVTFSATGAILKDSMIGPERSSCASFSGLAIDNGNRVYVSEVIDGDIVIRRFERAVGEGFPIRTPLWVGGDFRSSRRTAHRCEFISIKAPAQPRPNAIA